MFCFSYCLLRIFFPTFPLLQQNFNLVLRTRVGCAAYVASSPVGTGIDFPCGKAAGTWSWPLISIQRWVGTVPSLLMYCLINEHRGKCALAARVGQGRGADFTFAVRLPLWARPSYIQTKSIRISQQRAMTFPPTALSSSARQTRGTLGAHTFGSLPCASRKKEALLQCLQKSAGVSVRNQHKDIGLDSVG
jgi:hypothetical protein